MRYCGIFLAVVTWFSGSAYADFAKTVEGLEHKSGLLDVYCDPANAKVMVALSMDADGGYGRYVYAPYLTAGLGSNPVGLDRSMPVGSYILAFRRVGGRILAVMENTDFSATGSAAEQQAVKTSFAESVLWATDIIDETDDQVLIDFSGFLTRDSAGVAARLKARGQGSFAPDPKRSYVKTDAAFAFPDNVEFDAVVTFASKQPGPEVRATTPSPDAVSLIVHTSLIRLPDAGYTPRRFDQRAGLIGVSYVDMSAPLVGDVVTRFARRFRLEKDADGKVVDPIVFYVDHSVPEPMRTALQEGASWWATAFEKAGFPGGYRVEILPEDAHPLDARYNMINWVHRATRGWSYGYGVADPRTGETLRGVVLLGSLRVRQDIKIFEALMGAGKTGSGEADDPVQIALARIRQLAAHEVGHALGFAHNMAASTYGGRASVMDYPAPDIRLVGDRLDASQAYGVGMGVWDDWTVDFLYSYYGDMDPRTAQEARLKRAADSGLIYVEDRDSRSIGTGHVRGSLWDTGADAVDSLTAHMEVRAHALASFGEDNLRPGEGWAQLHVKFVPLYLYHRYQVQAAAKWIGGYDFRYRAAGDGRPDSTPLDYSQQMRALDAILATLQPEALRIPPRLLGQLTPLYGGDGDPQYDRERFDIGASPAFDQNTATAIAANLAFDALLNPRRLARVAQQGQRDGFGGLDDMIGRITNSVFVRPKRDPALAAIQATVQDRYIAHLIARYSGGNPSRARSVSATVNFASNRSPVALGVQATLMTELETIRSRLVRVTGAEKPQARLLAKRIADVFRRDGTPAYKAPPAPVTPPGSPIGAESCWHCGPYSGLR